MHRFVDYELKNSLRIIKFCYKIVASNKKISINNQGNEYDSNSIGILLYRNNRNLKNKI